MDTAIDWPTPSNYIQTRVSKMRVRIVSEDVVGITIAPTIVASSRPGARVIPNLIATLMRTAMISDTIKNQVAIATRGPWLSVVTTVLRFPIPAIERGCQIAPKDGNVLIE